MILVDSSIWIDHFRVGVPLLERYLHNRLVLSHPFVVGELAMGSLRNRRGMIEDFSNLPMAMVAEDFEVLSLVEQFKFFARGIGYLDAHLLASSRLTPDTSLWTRDRRLQEIAQEIGLSLDPSTSPLP